MSDKVKIGDVVYHCWNHDVIGYVVKVEDEWVYARTIDDVDFDFPEFETSHYEHVVNLREREAQKHRQLLTTLRAAGYEYRMSVKPPTTCQASFKDGECVWKDCPQIRDNEPEHTGRPCPLFDPKLDEEY